MNRIRRLDNETISKISAGEVILRPSNVVKELIENSIDAGSTFIEVEVEKGGKELIRVSDNGCGISREDLPLSIERYTTSKIDRIDDLNNIYSLGFRGEALASIAAVSRMTIISSDGESANKMEVENSNIISIKETAAPKGTTIIAKDLFYNLPVRKKFLKPDRTEMASIIDVFMRYVIAFNQIHFRLISSGRVVQEYFPQNNHLMRIHSVFMEFKEGELIEVYRTNNHIELLFFGSNFNVLRPDSRLIYTYVNRRFVNDRLLKRAITDAYANILPPQKYPAGILFLKIDPSEVDINIHPQKTEIRFKDPNRIFSEAYHLLNEFVSSLSPNVSKTEPVSIVEKVPKAPIYEIGESQHTYNRGGNLSPNPSISRNKAQDIFEPSGYFSSANILGTLEDRFIILSIQHSLLIVDQHAAQERILYNDIIKSYRSGKSITQRLLIPLNVEMNPLLIKRVEIFKDRLESIGFDIEIFGGNSVVIKGIPVSLTCGFSEQEFINIVSELDEDMGRLEEEDIIREIAARTACHTAVRGHRRLNDIEIKRLLIDMDKTDFSIACPHGRPVFFEITLEEIEKRLGRRQ
jgi:DNA mismatch repair protein MutL